VIVADSGSPIKEGFMQVDEIRVFIGSIDYELSQAFYQALGFSMAGVNDSLCLFENGGCHFFLQRGNSEAQVGQLILQVSVRDIEQAFATISNLTGFSITFDPIKIERWGKVIYLTGPAGEQLQITQFNGQSPVVKS